MSITAWWVGVAGTTQSKYRTVGSRSPVIQVNVWPPSSDRRNSVSHKFDSMPWGRIEFHSTLNTCPGTRTSPALGEISLATYRCPSGLSPAFTVLCDDGAKTKVNANKVTMNRRVFISQVHPRCGWLSRGISLVKQEYGRFGGHLDGPSAQRLVFMFEKMDCLWPKRSAGRTSFPLISISK